MWPGGEDLPGGFRAERVGGHLTVSEPHHKDRTFVRKQCAQFFCGQVSHIIGWIDAAFERRKLNGDVSAAGTAELLGGVLGGNFDAGHPHRFPFFLMDGHAVRQTAAHRFG